MKLHPQNPCPHQLEPAPSLNPVTISDLIDVIDIIIGGLEREQTSYYYGAARVRLDQLRKRL